MIKAVFFDLDDTLCDDAGAWIACARKAVAHGLAGIGEVTANAIADRFLAISELYWTGTAYMTETRPMLELRTSQFAQALGDAGLAARDNAAETMALRYGEIRSREIDLFPDAVEVLTTLRKRGLKLALITNGMVSTHVEKVEHLGLEKLCDYVVIADAVGMWKPDPVIFHHTLELCGVEAHEAIMVGDNLVNDVAGAQSAGIAALWFNPHSLSLSQDATAPALGEVRSLGELLDRDELFAVQ